MYEIEKRELLARFFLASKIISVFKSDVTVQIFQSTLLGYIAIRKKPGIVIIKSCPFQYYRYLNLMKRRGFIIILSQEEGVHYNKNLPDQLEFSKKCIPLIDKYLAWHLEDSLFAERMGIPSDKILITGNIRFELAYKISHSNISSKERILVLENFESTNIHKSVLKKNRLKYDLITKNYLDVLEKVSKSTINNYALYQNLYKILNDENISFRIRKYILVEKNVFDKKDYLQRTNILQDFIGKNFIVHYGSTAGLEAILAGKISLILANVESRVYNPIIYEVSKTFESPLELINFIRNLSEFEITKINDRQRRKLAEIHQINYANFMPSEFILNTILDYTRCKFTDDQISIYRINTFIFYYKNQFIDLIRRFIRPYLYINLKSFKLTERKIKSDFTFLQINTANLDWKIRNKGKLIKIQLKNTILL